MELCSQQPAGRKPAMSVPLATMHTGIPRGGAADSGNGETNCMPGRDKCTLMPLLARTFREFTYLDGLFIIGLPRSVGSPARHVLTARGPRLTRERVPLRRATMQALHVDAFEVDSPNVKYRYSHTGPPHRRRTRGCAHSHPAPLLCAARTTSSRRTSTSRPTCRCATAKR